MICFKAYISKVFNNYIKSTLNFLFLIKTIFNFIIFVISISMRRWVTFKSIYYLCFKTFSMIVLTITFTMTTNTTNPYKKSRYVFYTKRYVLYTERYISIRLDTFGDTENCTIPYFTR